MAVNAEQYLLSFLATLQGDKAVITGLTRMQSALNKQKKLHPELIKGTKTFGQALTDIGKRALLTIPAWLLLRTIFMGLIRTIGDVFRANLDLEEGMTRIQTVMAGTSSEIDRDMVRIKSVILDTAVNSRKSIKELAEAFYFLRTSNLSTEQALSAFTPTVALMVGTMNNAQDTARAVAGIFNTMRNQFKEGTSDAEVFQEIADGLAYTYATQDVQLQELTASYEKFAPYVSGLGDSFIEVITTLGFLNTRLLRAGRAGRLTGRTILQLSKNSSKLAQIFGITFDPNKPISFINVIRQINNTLDKSVGLTEKQSRQIQEVFATRGAVAVRLLIDSFDEWNDSLKNAGNNAEGFADKMQKIRMRTVTAQAERMKNVLAVLGNDFITGATSGQSFAHVLEDINDWLISIRKKVRAVGDIFGFLSWRLGEVSVMYEKMASQAGKALIDPLNAFEAPDINIKLTSLDDYMMMQLETEKSTKKEAELRKEIEKTEKDMSKSIGKNTDSYKEREVELKNQVELLKISGVHEKDIVKFRLQQLDILEGFMTEEEARLERLKLGLDLIKAEAKYRKEMTDNLRNNMMDLLKTMGASESQILEIKIHQLKVDKDQIGDAQYLLQLSDLRRQQQIALIKEKQKELDIATDLAMKYKESDENERTRLRRLMELRRLSPEALAVAYERDMFDQRIIDEYFQHFSEEGQRAVGKVIRDMFDLPALAIPGVANTPKEQIEELLNPTKVNPFWDTWEGRARLALDNFRKEWENIFGTAGARMGTRDINAPFVKNTQNFDLKTQIENIEVNLPENALDNVATRAGEMLKEALLSNEDFQRKFSEKLRNLL